MTAKRAASAGPPRIPLITGTSADCLGDGAGWSSWMKWLACGRWTTTLLGKVSCNRLTANDRHLVVTQQEP